MARPKNIELIKAKDLDAWLSSVGFLYIGSELELERFNKLYEEYRFKLDNESLDPESIINNTFNRASRTLNIEKYIDEEEVMDLRMVARKGVKNLPQNVIDKMRDKHKKDSDGSK